jgi:hypothetical protein
MTTPWYAIVFNRDRQPGAEPDHGQHWTRGDLYSVGTVVDRPALPDWFDVIEIDGPPGDRLWDVGRRAFVAPPQT